MSGEKTCVFDDDIFCCSTMIEEFWVERSEISIFEKFNPKLVQVVLAYTNLKCLTSWNTTRTVLCPASCLINTNKGSKLHNEDYTTLKEAFRAIS